MHDLELPDTEKFNKYIDLNLICKQTAEMKSQFHEKINFVELLYLHSKNAKFILQGFFARLTMYNFYELITSHIIIDNKHKNMSIKLIFLSLYIYTVNFY